MSEFKFLIDTNIVIGLEDNHPVEAELTELTRRCSESGVRIFVASAVVDDIKRDMDLARRAVTESKLARFERLRGIEYPDDTELARRFGTINNLNDRSDCRLLYCIERKAADFLVTRDVGLLKRARRSHFGNAVLSVEEAVQWLRQTFEPTAIELPHVFEREAYALNLNDSLFDSLRDDYEGFNDWFAKCAREHRKCWVVEVGGALAGIVIRKDETRSESCIKSPGNKILKLCTFKMAQAYRGEKFGEQLLKQCLWFAQSNGYDVVYLTAYANKEELLYLLQSFGFKITGRKENHELIVEKVMQKGILVVDPKTNILDLDRAAYPRFVDGKEVNKYCVPIQGAYHEKLFPEISFRVPLPLFSAPGMDRERTVTSRQVRTPGNTIRKVYICRAQKKWLKAGDLLFFYLSKDNRLEFSQSITTVGIVESCRESKTPEDLIRMTAKRSVFTALELTSRQMASPRPMKVIDFLLAGHSTPPIGIETLIKAGIFNGRPPQSIARIEEDSYLRLRPLLKLGYEI